MSPPPIAGKKDIKIGLYAGSVYSVGLFRSDNENVMAEVNQRTWKEDWMGLYSFFLNEQKITDIKIPGAHNSASYTFPYMALNYQAKTQTQTITAQLNSGIRFFDLRVQKVTDSSLTSLYGVN